MIALACPSARPAEVAASGADLGRPVRATCCHRRNTVGELDLADRAQLDRALGAVHRQPFEVDGRRDVVSAAGVGEEVRQQIAAGLGPVDQVVMRIDDRQPGLDSGEVITVVIMVLALSFLATICPSSHAARLDAVEALRYE
jgi:hypothetical protein